MEFKKILNLINPRPRIGGLEISDGFLRCCFLKEKKFFFTQLVPGIIEGGKVKDKEKFISALLAFHSKIVSSRKDKIHVVCSIADINVYTEKFSLPQSAISNLEDAAGLNLQMISPIDFPSAYSDWQLVGEKSGETNQLEMLGAFVSKEIIDNYADALGKAGFEIVAIEFSGLSVARALADYGEGIAANANYLLIKVGGDGLSFGLIKSGRLYFLHAVSWNSVYGNNRNVKFEEFLNLIIEETKKVVSFYETHSSSSLAGVILISSTLEDKILNAVRENFSNLSVIKPSLKEFPDVDFAWFGAMGASLRGEAADLEENLISLTAFKTEEKISFYKIAAFVKIWRDIIFSVLIILFLLYLGADVFISQRLSKVEGVLNSGLSANQTARYEELKNAASDFNKKTGLIYAAFGEKFAWSGVLNKILDKAGTDIVVTRISAQISNSAVILSGEAKDSDAVVKFKDILEADEDFFNVDLPLSSINSSGDKVSFTLSFGIER